jgi:Tfp pilus assembly protein FimT
VKKKRNSERMHGGASGGFSILELVISMTVMLTLGAIAVPNVTRTMKIYQLGSQANLVANQLKATRSEAIRRNNTVNCVIDITGGIYRIWSDPDRDGVYDVGDQTLLLSSEPTLVAAGAVATAGDLPALVRVTGMNTLSGSGGTVTFGFDARGAVTGGALNAVNVLYVENPGRPADGYRAVVLLPSGSIQTWSGAPGGVWSRVN